MGRLFKKLNGKSRLFTFFVIVAPFLALSVLVFSWKKYVSEATCGCGGAGDIANQTGNYDPAATQAIFNNEPVSIRMADLSPTLSYIESQKESVLGENTDVRWIEVDISDQKLYAHNGDNVDYIFLVSSGKTGPTPRGDFRIWIKYKYTKMEGGKKENKTYYYLPNVPFTQYFYKDYGLHGAYWHNNFGHPMSHGCVNLSVADAEKLYYWTTPVIPEGKNMAKATPENPGTRVIIHD